MSRKGWIVTALTLLFAFLTGYINLNAAEVQAPLACMLGFSFLSGLLQSKAAWRWAIVLALSIPLSYFVGVVLQYPMVDPPRSLPFDPKFLILIVPALVAAYSGALLSQVVWPLKNQPS
jgi:hypothetical protein